MFCKECGNQIPDAAAICMNCGVATENARGLGNSASKSRVTYVLLGFFLGSFGIHNFYAGYTGKAVAQLLITLLISWWLIIPIFLIWIWVIVEICTVTEDAHGLKFS